MEVRQLKWIPQTTSKKRIELHSEEELIDEGYWIQNYFECKRKLIFDGSVYLVYYTNYANKPRKRYERKLKFKSIEEAKQKAQELFEAKIVQFFGAPPVSRKVLSEKYKRKHKQQRIRKPRPTIEQLDLELFQEEMLLPECPF